MAGLVWGGLEEVEGVAVCACGVRGALKAAGDDGTGLALVVG